MFAVWCSCWPERRCGLSAVLIPARPPEHFGWLPQWPHANWVSFLPPRPLERRLEKCLGESPRVVCVGRMVNRKPSVSRDYVTSSFAARFAWRKFLAWHARAGFAPIYVAAIVRKAGRKNSRAAPHFSQSPAMRKLDVAWLAGLSLVIVWQ
jgi:hypothetical protein